jgi:aspartate aminotransferase
MTVANTIREQLERASWIRRMFEEGARLKAERGAEKVFDFTLGNPVVAPPAEVTATLWRIAAEAPSRGHGYMPNAGYPAVREVIAEWLSRRTGLPFTAGHVLMTVGSGGAINSVLKAILDSGDEVIVPMPCFSEYPFYVENHGGRMVAVDTDETFQLDVSRIAQSVTPRTKAIILNSPHNPTGAVYSAEALRELEALLSGLERPIVVISDEPYRELVFDGRRPPEIASIITRAVIADSWSKAFAIAGERIGYLAISPRLPDAGALSDACTFATRVLGFVNAPAIWQWVVAEALDAEVDVAHYQEKRDLLCDGLVRIGYEVTRPQGAFYVFPRTPIPDDVAFVSRLQQEGILAVPGVGFGRAGHMRLSLTVPRETIEAALPGFERAFGA